jgi:thioredoxin-like negative regulator of GroEL
VVKYKLPFANGRDPDLAIARAFKVEATPTTFLISKDGTLLMRNTGTFPEMKLTEALDRLLAVTQRE